MRTEALTRRQVIFQKVKHHPFTRAIDWVVMYMLPPFLAVAFVAPVALWTLDTSSPVTIFDVKVATPNVARQGKLMLSYIMAFNKRCSGDGMRSFVDSTGHLLLIEPYHFRNGVLTDGVPAELHVAKSIDVEATVPSSIAAGAAQFLNVTDFYCNPLQRLRGTPLRVEYPPASFMVADATEPQISRPKTVFAPVQDAPSTMDMLRDALGSPNDPWRR